MFSKRSESNELILASFEYFLTMRIVYRITLQLYYKLQQFLQPKNYNNNDDNTTIDDI